MKKFLAVTLSILVICVSGCASTTKSPVSPANLNVSIESLVIKEFNEQDVSALVSNNDIDQAIDSVSVSSFDPFKIVGLSSQVNIPAGKKAGVSFRVMAPSFNGAENSSKLVLSYASGVNKEGKPILNTKVVPVQTIILPDARLQFVGFAESMDNLLAAPPVSTWETEKGKNITVKFSVKNQGQSTIIGDSMYVLVDIENKLIGSSASVNITEGMAKAGTSYTRGVQLPILEDAPNGETNVYVKLMKGDYLLDSQTLVLKVKL
jgi:hypothetical protein